MKHTDGFLKAFKYSKPLAGNRTVNKMPVHTPRLAGNRIEDSKLSDYKPYKKRSE